MYVVGGDYVWAVKDPPLIAQAYRETHRKAQRDTKIHHCEIRLAPECGGEGGMENWPWLCGKFLLLFTVCPACRDRARQIAEDGRELAEMAAYERLPELPNPPWARTAPWWRRWWAALRLWLNRHTPGGR
jgi:hypothetical protein